MWHLGSSTLEGQQTMLISFLLKAATNSYLILPVSLIQLSIITTSHGMTGGGRTETCQQTELSGRSSLNVNAITKQSTPLKCGENVDAF